MIDNGTWFKAVVCILGTSGGKFRLIICRKVSAITGIIIVFFFLGCTSERQRIDLAGEWSFEFDRNGTGEKENFFSKEFSDKLMLPGTTETNGKGEPNPKKDETNHLTRKYPYKGRVWYKRMVDIPQPDGIRVFE